MESITIKQKAVIYARVSTVDQDTERQFTELTKLAKSEGYSNTKIFQDSATGDANKKEYFDRIGFAAMLEYIQMNNINQVYCWELSRLGRTMIENHKIIKDFRARQINIYTQKEGINTKNNDANTQLQLNILSAIAEYELSTIKSRTMSGMYHSITKGGVGGGLVKQYGYKSEDGKLVIDEEEKAVILDIVDKYLNQDYSIAQITDFLNESAVETKFKKLIDKNALNPKKPSKFKWNGSTVARMFHKKLLTGWRTYGKVELQIESLRILDDATFNALQEKMAGLRDKNPNAMKFENILKGILRCGNCGGPMVMTKSTDGAHHHYKCFNRFYNKSGCKASMIDLDLLNNTIYEKTKDYTVDSKDVASKIEKLEAQVSLNNTAINQINAELASIASRENRLVGLYINGQVNLNIYETQLNTIKADAAVNTEKLLKLESANNKLNAEIVELSSKKSVNLTNPVVFKSNIKSLVREISVKTLDDYDLSELDRMATHYAGKPETFIERKHKRDIIYSVDVKMFDDIVTYSSVVSNKTTIYNKIISVGLI